jgi:hypothetical protein
LLFIGLPGAVAMFRALNAKRRIYFLREKQKELILEWNECLLPAGEDPQQLKVLASESNNGAKEHSAPVQTSANVTTQA